jgi:hypothetical protein
VASFRRQSRIESLPIASLTIVLFVVRPRISLSNPAHGPAQRFLIFAFGLLPFDFLWRSHRTRAWLPV